MKKTDMIIKSLLVAFAAMLMGVGISMFYFSGLGSDPISTFIEAMAQIFNLQSGQMSMIVNMIIVIVFLFIRKDLIKLGTFIQAMFVGVGINIGMGLWFSLWFDKVPFLYGGIIDIFGAILIGISLGLYIPLEFGAGPLDLMILSVCDGINKSYKWGFYIVYGLFLTAGILLGGTWGVGTLISLALTGWVADYFIPKMAIVYGKNFD